MNEALVWTDILREFPRARLARKADSWLFAIIGLIAPSTATNYTTTIGTTVYVPSSWDHYTDDDRAGILVHERIHMRQYRRLSVPLFLLLYLFCFLPIGLAYFRYRLEREAYLEDLRRGHSAEWIAEELSGRSYLFAWPWKASIIRWLEAHR